MYLEGSTRNFYSFDVFYGVIERFTGSFVSTLLSENYLLSKCTNRATTPN